MKIKVIGGSGFIGTRLVERLNRLYGEDNVKIVDIRQSQRFSSQYIFGDVTDRESMTKALRDSDIVFNLAAEHKDNVYPIEKYDQVNVVGAKNICDACEVNDIKNIVFTSSVAIYGFAPIGTDETGDVNYFNDYGRTKWEAEKVFTSWFEENSKEKKLVVIRPTVVFGEGNRGNVFNLFSQIASGKFMMIGSGNNRKSMAYVENVAAFLEKAGVELSQGKHTFNYVDKPDLSMNDLVAIVKKSLGKNDKSLRLSIPYGIGLAAGTTLDLISKLTKREFPISRVRVEKFCKDTVFSSSNTMLDFQPPFTLTEAIERTISNEF